MTKKLAKKFSLITVRRGRAYRIRRIGCSRAAGQKDLRQMAVPAAVLRSPSSSAPSPPLFSGAVHVSGSYPLNKYNSFEVFVGIESFVLSVTAFSKFYFSDCNNT